MYCIEKKLKRYNYKDQINVWINSHYFRISSLKEFAEMATFGFKESSLIHINAYEAWYLVLDTDDFYGRDAFMKLGKFLKEIKTTEKNHYAMVAYLLKNTLIHLRKTMTFMLKEQKPL